MYGEGTYGKGFPLQLNADSPSAGLSEVPEAGDEFRAVSDERMARELVEKRKFGDDLFVFVLSQEKSPIKTSIKIATTKKPLAVNLRTGEITDVEYRQDGEYVVVDKELDAYEEFAIICSDSMAYKKAEASASAFFMTYFIFRVTVTVLTVLPHLSFTTQ